MRLNFVRKAFAVCIAAAFLAGCASSTGLRYADDSETYDGLTRVEGTTMSNVWVRRDTDLSQYDKVRFEGAGIKYTPIKPLARSALAPMRSNEFPLSDANKERFEQMLATTFRSELSQIKSYQISDSNGADVLLVSVGLLDVVSRVPPDAAERTDVYIDEVARATLVLEIKDSLSGAVLVRAADRRSAEAATPGYGANTAAGWADIQRLANYWAGLMRDGIDALKTDLDSL